MHHANHFYGHAHVLARYCGLDADDPPRIRGYLQHGWNIGDGIAPGTPYVGHSPVFVWSDQTRRRAQILGRPNAIAIGAPWVYLLEMERDHDRVSAPRGEGTLWYPFHGWEGQDLVGDHRRLIETIRAVEPGPVTVCLYWNEFHKRHTRRRYERAGFRVICHGYRGRWWDRTDPQFLLNQLAELRAHRRVASNRLSTAVFYGASVGCDIAVYGDPMVLRDEDTEHGGYARIRRQWRAIHGEQVDATTAREVAASELGIELRASPVELRAVLGWSGSEDT